MAEKKLVIRSYDDPQLNDVISYIQNNKNDFKFHLKKLYLPYVTSPDNPAYRQIAIESIYQFEAWAATLREIVGLVKKTEVINYHPQLVGTTRTDNEELIDNSISSSSKEDADEEEEDDDDDDDFEFSVSSFDSIG